MHPQIDVFKADIEGNAPLSKAKTIEIANLIKAKPVEEIKKKYGLDENAFVLACAKNDIEDVKILIASGEDVNQYDKNKMTCAHNDYAYGTMLKVTHLGNKKSVVVKVIDRGPYIRGRIVDLSRAAATNIGLIQDGIAQVKVELVNTKSQELATKGTKTPNKYSVPSNTRKSVEETIKRNNARAVDTQKPVKKAHVKTTTVPKKEAPITKPAPKNISKVTAKSALPMMNGSDFKNAELLQISILKPRKEGFGVQVASLSDYNGVLKKVADLQGKWFSNILISTEKDAGAKNIYKIILGQFETREQANSYKKDLKKNKKILGFVVALGDE